MRIGATRFPTVQLCAGKSVYSYMRGRLLASQVQCTITCCLQLGKKSWNDKNNWSCECPREQESHRRPCSHGHPGRPSTTGLPQLLGETLSLCARWSSRSGPCSRSPRGWDLTESVSKSRRWQPQKGTGLNQLPGSREHLLGPRLEAP